VQYDFSQPIDLNNLPASLVLAAEQDPARSLPGAPPLFGRDVVPHFYTTTGYIGSAARAYPVEDEATRNSVENSIRMRTECAIMECLESRQRATALLKWHLAPENDKSEKQQSLCRELSRIIDRIPRFVEYRRVLLEALWYGKYAVANKFAMAKVGGKYRTTIADWTPRDGDKLMFRYDDGTQKFKEGQLGIRVHANFGSNMLPKLSPADAARRKRIEPTQYGLVYWFNDYERETMIVHKHMVEDGPWREPRMMGRILGVGIRDRIYWTWYAMQALLQDLLTYSNRAALGVRLWRYPSGNEEWKKKVEAAAKDAIANGVADILFPVEPNDYASLYGVEQIEPGTAGAQLLAELIERFFLKKIKKYILGQLLTSEAEATGLGSGVAQAHLATFSDIVQYDAANLQETLTHELVRKIQKENAPKSMGVFVRFVLDTDTPDTEKRLQAIQAAYQMDVPIKVEDIYMLTGLSKPEARDEIISVSLQQQKQQRQQNQMMMEQQAMMAASQGMGGMPPGAEQGAPPQETGQEVGAPDARVEQAAMDVSPENVRGTEGPILPASGHLEEKAALDQPAPGAPWTGFFESLFNALDGRRPVAPAEDEEPERYDEPQNELVGALQGAMDDYERHQRSVEDFKYDLANALESQNQLSDDVTSAFDKQALVNRLENAFDFETLVDAVDRTFDAIYLRDELTALLAQRMAEDHRNHSARDELLKALNKQFGYGVEKYAHAWAPYRGPRQGKGWKNFSTGEVRYQEKSPDRDAKPETDLRHHRWGKNGDDSKSIHITKLEQETPYVGFDLDGTLAKFDKWQGPGHIGPPVPKMVAKVKKFLDKGIQVRIITARLGLPGKEAEVAHRAIQKWTKQHIGKPLKVQAHKTPGLVKLYDDKVERVEKNTGETDKYTCTAADIEEAIRSWHPPTEGQAEAGNYRKPRVRLHGMEIAIENPKGTRRKPEWPELSASYGYISRIGNQSSDESKDGEKPDVFLCHSHPESEIVFVIDQEKPDGRFDEHKVVMGAISEDQAANVYLDNYPDGWHCGPITSMAVPQFKAWLECGDLTKRVAHQVSKYMAAYEADPEYYARKAKFNPLQKTLDFDAPKPAPAAAPSAGQSVAGSPWVRMKGERGSTYWYNKVTNPQNDPAGRKYQEEMPSEGGEASEASTQIQHALSPSDKSSMLADIGMQASTGRMNPDAEQKLMSLLGVESMAEIPRALKSSDDKTLRVAHDIAIQDRESQRQRASDTQHQERMREFKRGVVSDRQAFDEIDYWTNPPLADKNHPMFKVDKDLESDPVFEKLLDKAVAATDRTDADDPGTLPEGRAVDAYRLRKARSMGIEVPFGVLKAYRKELMDLPLQHDPSSVPSPGRAAAMQKRKELDAAEQPSEPEQKQADPSELRRQLQSVSNRANRKPYESLDASIMHTLAQSGYVYAKGKNKGKLTELGYRQLRELDRSVGAQKLKDDADWDTKQDELIQRIEAGEPVTQQELKDYALAGTDWETRAKITPGEPSTAADLLAMSPEEQRAFVERHNLAKRGLSRTPQETPHEAYERRMSLEQTKQQTRGRKQRPETPAERRASMREAEQEARQWAQQLAEAQIGMVKRITESGVSPEQPQEQPDAQSREQAAHTEPESPAGEPEATEQAGQAEQENTAEQPEGHTDAAFAPVVWDAVQKALDSGQSVTFGTHTRATEITPKNQDALRFRNGEIQVRSGKNWQTVAFNALDSLAKGAGVKRPPMPSGGDEPDENWSRDKFNRIVADYFDGDWEKASSAVSDSDMDYDQFIEHMESQPEQPPIDVPDIDDDVVHNWDAPYIQKQWAGKLTDEQKRDMNDAMRQHHQKGIDADVLVRQLKAKWSQQPERHSQQFSDGQLEQLHDFASTLYMALAEEGA
jgi:phage gp29-like protein